MANYVTYYRVSTVKQTENKKRSIDMNGLGLQAQQNACEAYIRSVNGTEIRSFKEVQSAAGSKDRIQAGMNVNLQSLLRKRPLLLEAIEYAKKHKATLIIKEVSRLTRYKLLGEYLMSTGVKFICADYPNDAPMMLSFRIAMYQEEAEQVSLRTKAAIKVRIATKGNWNRNHSEEVLNGTYTAKAHAAKAAIARNSAANKIAANIICSRLKEGATLLQCANELNKLGCKTSKSFDFTTTQVARLRDMFC